MNDYIQTIKAWRADPLTFAIEAFGFNPSNQQRELFIETGKLVRAKCKVDEGVPLDPGEERYARARGISVMSGKGTGKNAAGAILVFWFHFCYESRIYLVAPSLETLKSNLLSEMSYWKTRKEPDGTPCCPIGDEFDLKGTSCNLKSDPENGKSWYVRTATAGPNAPAHQQLEVLQGKHHRYMMFVIDEASGVPDAVFSPLDTTLTDPVNFIIMFFNPTRRTGFAYNTHFGQEREYWIQLQWDAENSTLVTPMQIDYLKKKYGADSPEYRVSVRGLPPEADPDSVIPYEWCVDAAEQEPPPPDLVASYPCVLGVDVARFGEDKSVICVRRGPVIEELIEYSHLDSIELARWIMAVAADNEPQAIYIDTAGLGVGVYDALRHLGQPGVISVNVGCSASSDKYARMRDELWFRLRAAFERKKIFIPRDPQLFAELSSPKFKIEDTGKVKVESKKDMKRRKMPSPNKADAIMLTFFHDISYLEGVVSDDKEEEFRERRRPTVSMRSKYSWMTL